ncbi:hypothetical protein [Yoonia sp.]|uniref:hypothetical protein n=1 Tax=Yoonia sp. TaxID=2212373 RepID=UPI00391DB84E
MTRENKAVAFAYACFAVMSAGVGVFVLRSSGYFPVSGAVTGIYDYWMLLATLLAGPLSLRLARGWIGYPGVLGNMRALIGCCVGLFLASVIGGTMIMPLYGTIQAPLMVLTGILVQPLIGVIWFVGVMLVHRVIVQADAARQAWVRLKQQEAMSALSPLSQTYFYRK